MSKAVLVMDMPSSCDKCPCFCGHYSDMCCMALNNRAINYPYPKDFRQSWCPLKELPHKRYHSAYGVPIEMSEDKIWNECISIILGENKDNK